MTIKDVEVRTGLERANIRFYEKEGLLSPVRSENGYRDYSEADVRTLLRIKLLRRVHLTLDEIKALQAGELELTEALKAQIAALEREQQAAENAQKLCRWMVEDRAAFETLDAEKYLRDLPEPAGETFTAADMEPQAFCPWRRFFARSLDLWVYSMVFGAAFCLLSGMPLQDMKGIVMDIAGMVIMLLAEPLLLRRFGTTLGKYCFGLYIESADGGRLSYGEGFARTAGALFSGMAVRIPLVRLYTMWKSYKRCTNNESQPWEKDTPINYSYRFGNGRCALSFVVVMVLTFGLLFASAAAQRMAPNRGELTVAEFAENVNHARKYYLEDSTRVLDEYGQWTGAQSGGIVVSGPATHITPKLEYTMDGEAVTAVSFSAEGGYTLVNLPFKDMAALAMGLAGAGKEAGFAPQTMAELANRVWQSGFDLANQETNEFYLSQYGVTVSWTLTQHGYHIIGMELFRDEVGCGYCLSFRVERT